MKRTTLETAVNNEQTVIYLATYNGRGAFEPHTIGAKSDDGLTYALIAQNGTTWRYYWSQTVYIPK